MASLIGALLQNPLNKWLQNSLIQIYNNSQGANQFGLNQALGPSTGLQDAANNLINLGTQFSFGSADNPGGAFTRLSDDLNSVYGNLNPGQFQQNGLSSQSRASGGDLYNVAGGMQGNQDYLSQLLQSGGATGLSQGIADNLSGLLGNSGNQFLQNTGGNLVNSQGQNQMTMDLQNIARMYGSNGGMTPTLQNASNYANNLAAAGGMTPQLAQLFGQGNKLMTTGGNTPFTQGGQNAALSGFQGGGATPFLSSMQNLGQNLASQNPLIGPGMQVSFARDQAAQNLKNAAINARKQAVLRGGGPGSVVANGTSNQDLADFGDQGASAVSQAVQNALLQSQGLGLQEQGLGASMGLGAAGTQASQLGAYGNSLANLAGVSNQLYGIGANTATNAANSGVNALESALGLMPTVQNSATNLMGTSGQLGLGAGNLALGNMNSGAGMLNDFNQESLGANNLLNSVFGNQNQYALGAGGLYNQGQGIQGNVLNNLYQGNISGDQLGLSQANSFQGSLQNLLNQRSGVAGQGLNLINSGMGPLGQLTNNWTNYASNGLNLQHGLFNDYNPTSAYGNFFNGIGKNLPSTGISGLDNGLGIIFG